MVNNIKENVKSIQKVFARSDYFGDEHLEPLWLPDENEEADCEDVSVELLYAKELASNPTLAVQVRSENAMMYRWTGSYWSSLNNFEGKRMALSWLEKNFPAEADKRKVASAFEIGLYKLQQLPPKPKENIIPFMNDWVMVNDDGSFTVMEPKSAWGITYRIRAHLQHEGHNTLYEPSPLPEDSYFSRFIHSSLPDEKERELVQEYCGYTLLNDVRHQVAQVWEGNGQNGKSVLLKLIASIHEKASAIRLDNLEKHGLTPLVDASLIVSSETPKRGINEQVLKGCISGDPVQIEPKHKDEFTYSPTAKWIIVCNRFPKISDESDGVWRRLQYIRWSEQIGNDKVVQDVDQIIIENELHVFTDWCLLGLQRLLKKGRFNLPASVVQRTNEEKLVSNSVLAFVKDQHLELDTDGHSIQKTVIYNNYKSFCEEDGLIAYGGVEFWKRLRQVFPKLTEVQKRLEGERVRCINLTYGDVENAILEKMAERRK